MTDLQLPASKETPLVNLSEGGCLFEGRSLPENALDFYTPIKDWFNNYNDTQQNQNLSITFKFDYFNTSSAKQLTSIFISLQEIAKTNKLNICWKCFDYDTDIHKAGQRFQELFDIDFRIEFL